MTLEDLEPEMEALLHRLVPDMDDQLRGATEDQVDRIEAIAGKPLPQFYRWFLLRMGGDMGPLRYPSIDFSASKVLSCYDDGLFVTDGRFLMIAYDDDQIMSMHKVYDLDLPARNDAAVVSMEGPGEDIHPSFETFREMLAWGKFVNHRVDMLERACVGTIHSEHGDVAAELDPVMTTLGFDAPVPTGPYCGLYDHPSSAMVTSAEPVGKPDILAFRIGGASDGAIRRTLGAIQHETRLTLEIEEWSQL